MGRILIWMVHEQAQDLKQIRSDMAELRAAMKAQQAVA